MKPDDFTEITYRQRRYERTALGNPDEASESSGGVGGPFRYETWNSGIPFQYPELR